MGEKIFRADRRNAARAGRVLRLWRERPRIRTGLWGWRSDTMPDGKRGDPYKVYTFIVGAAA